jgi:hypothetical protein
MGFANTITVLLSSSVTTSRAVNLDWMNGSPTAVSVTASSSGASALVYSIQYTLDDVMQTASSLVSWITDPNATALTSASSGIYLYSQPLAAIRITSTTANTSSNITTMKVTQGSWL